MILETPVNQLAFDVFRVLAGQWRSCDLVATRHLTARARGNPALLASTKRMPISLCRKLRPPCGMRKLCRPAYCLEGSEGLESRIC